jgi:hypothetical protein
MPIMEVRYSAGRLDAAAKADLAKKLTDVLIRMEGGVLVGGLRIVTRFSGSSMKRTRRAGRSSI